MGLALAEADAVPERMAKMIGGRLLVGKRPCSPFATAVDSFSTNIPHRKPDGRLQAIEAHR